MDKRSSTPLQVRMKNDVLQELKDTAEEMGTTQVGLVKLCVVAFIRWAKENNIRRLPDDWLDIISAMDGRRAHSHVSEDSATYKTRKDKSTPIKRIKKRRDDRKT